MVFDIFLNGELINTIVASEEFCEKYCSANGYTYELMPEPEPEPEPTPEPTEADDTASMLVDHEFRLTLLELGLNEP